MNFNEIRNIPCDVHLVNPDICSITFTLPTLHVKAFAAVFDSLSTLMTGISWKCKTDENGIRARNEKKRLQIDEFNQQFNDAVIKVYKSYINQSFTSRESFSLTVSKIHEEFPFSSYDIVKSCLIKNKLLKNTGFYKSRHTYE